MSTWKYVCLYLAWCVFALLTGLLLGRVVAYGACMPGEVTTPLFVCSHQLLWYVGGETIVQLPGVPATRSCDCSGFPTCAVTVANANDPASAEATFDLPAYHRCAVRFSECRVGEATTVADVDRCVFAFLTGAAACPPCASIADVLTTVQEFLQ